MTALLYDVLDVERTATTEEIRTAWRSAVADLDPTERRFRLYNEAAEVLLDPARRASYDEGLAATADIPGHADTEPGDPDAGAEADAERPGRGRAVRPASRAARARPGCWWRWPRWSRSPWSASGCC